MTRSHIALLLALVLVLAGALSACTRQDDARAQSGKAQAQHTPTSSPITRIEQVPVYPGAVKTDEQCRSDPDDRCKHRFSTTASLQAAADFYIATLTGRGWTVTSDDVGGTTRNMNFAHIARTAEGQSVRRWINIYLVADAEEAIIDIGFERWPDPMAIAVPQDGDGVTESWDNSGSEAELTITYTSSRSPDRILDFHKRAMSEQGWQYGSASDERDKDGKLLPAFFYSRRDIQGPYLGSNVRLYTTVLEDGKTAVRLVAHGRDVMAAYESLHK